MLGPGELVDRRWCAVEGPASALCASCGGVLGRTFTTGRSTSTGGTEWARACWASSTTVCVCAAAVGGGEVWFSSDERPLVSMSWGRDKKRSRDEPNGAVYKGDHLRDNGGMCRQLRTECAVRGAHRVRSVFHASATSE